MVIQGCSKFAKVLPMSVKLLFPLILFFWQNSAFALTQPDFDKIQDDQNQAFSSLYLAPNEDSYWQFAPSLSERTDVLLSVGTFRTLVAASYGKFDHVIMADLDQRIVDFNKRQIAALKVSKTVESFLAHLLGYRESQAAIHEAMQGHPEQLQNFIATHVQDGPETQYILKVASLAAKDPSNSFLKDPAAYDRLHQLAVEGRIYAVAASLANTTTYYKIAELLKRENLKVGAIDVSNVPDYICLRKNLSEFLYNLMTLPFTSDAVINQTAYNTPEKYKGVSTTWGYISVPLKAFLSLAIKKRQIGNDMGFYLFFRKQWLAEISETPIDILHRNQCSRIFAN